MERRIYLASPYTSPDEDVRISRYGAACLVTAQLSKEGLLVFSPIVHGHPLASYGLPVGFDFWQRHCLSFLKSWATELCVLTIPGWENSRGVKAEIQFAQERDMPIFLLSLLGHMEPFHG